MARIAVLVETPDATPLTASGVALHLNLGSGCDPHGPAYAVTEIQPRPVPAPAASPPAYLADPELRDNKTGRRPCQTNATRMPHAENLDPANEPADAGRQAANDRVAAAGPAVTARSPD